MKSEILSVKEKIGYGMGDAASHIIFDNVMLYMMFFYTDIFWYSGRICRHHVPAGPRAGCYLRPLHGTARRPHPVALGEIPPVGTVWRTAVWPGLRAGLQYARSQSKTAK